MQTRWTAIAVTALLAALTALALGGCNNGAARIEVDLLDFVPARAGILLETAPGTTDQEYSWRAAPCLVSLPEGTAQVLDVDRTELTFEADLSADQPASAELTLYFSAGSSQPYSDSLAFRLSRSQELPARFSLVSSDPQLGRIFGHGRFYVGIKLSFSRMGAESDPAGAAELAISRFSALVTGRQERY